MSSITSINKMWKIAYVSPLLINMLSTIIIKKANVSAFLVSLQNQRKRRYYRNVKNVTYQKVCYNQVTLDIIIKRKDYNPKRYFFVNSKELSNQTYILRKYRDKFTKCYCYCYCLPTIPKFMYVRRVCGNRKMSIKCSLVII